MRRGIRAVACGLALLALWQPAASEAGALGRVLGRGATKAPVPRWAPKPGAPTNILKQDLKNHRKAPVRPLAKDRTVFRFTTKDQAREAQRKGLPPEAHMTARGGPGRPLRPDHARSRYGLPKKPDARMTVHLKKGQPVRSNKIAGGDRRFGEVTSPAPLPPSSVVRVTPLKPRSR